MDDAGQGDASVDAGADAPSPAVLGAMRLYELAGSRATTLALSVSFHGPFSHDYDDRQGPFGCTADHYDAATKPAPGDSQAGLLRVSGFAGGRTVTGDVAANPIGCVRPGAYYACTYPAGTSALDAAFAPSVSPLGSGPVGFAGNGGLDFGAFYIDGSPDEGTLDVAEDLASIHYDPATDTVFHTTCSNGCPSSRIAAELTAVAASSAASGWPYPSVGVVRCVFAAAPLVTIPHEALAAAMASDARLDSIATVIVRLPAAMLETRDLTGNLLAADVGRGVAGTAPR